MTSLVEHNSTPAFDKVVVQALIGFCFSMLLVRFFIPNSPLRIPHFASRIFPQATPVGT